MSRVTQASSVPAAEKLALRCQSQRADHQNGAFSGGGGLPHGRQQWCRVRRHAGPGQPIELKKRGSALRLTPGVQRPGRRTQVRLLELEKPDLYRDDSRTMPRSQRDSAADQRARSGKWAPPNDSRPPP